MDYHITVGTYGTRLHGGDKPTVERYHNHGEEFVPVDPKWERFERDRMVQNPVYLTDEQRQFVEEIIPSLCEREKWIYHLAACQADHFHLLVSGDVEAKKIRRWLKQWLTSALNEKFGKQQWFAECGSTKYLYEKGYFEAVYQYIEKQRFRETTISIFDTHAHLDLPQFDEDRVDLIRRLESGNGDVVAGSLVEIAGVLIPGIDAASCRKAFEIAALSELLHVAVAIHPNHTAEATEEDWQTIVELSQQENVVAIGETGLDRYWNDAPFETQIDWFHRHIKLSRETDKPILIHCRDAWGDLLPILRQAGKMKAVIHAFSGNAEQMLACVELGFYISFAGSVTYRNAKFAPLWEAAQQTPLDRLLIETDAPFMTPHPFRGKLPRNEPTLAALVAMRLAELRNVPAQTIADATTQNALRLF